MGALSFQMGFVVTHQMQTELKDISKNERLKFISKSLAKISDNFETITSKIIMYQCKTKLVG